jgi:Family of unknown function (DUF5362)
MESTNESSLFSLQIDHNGSSFLSEAAKWAKFLGILGFIFSALYVLGGLFAGSVMSAAFRTFGGGAGFAGGAFVSIFYIGCAVLSFFPALYLYNFGAKMQIALRANDQDQLNLGFKNLKSNLRFVGILVIICLGFAVLGLILAIFAAGSMMR